MANPAVFFPRTDREEPSVRPFIAAGFTRVRTAALLCRPKSVGGIALLQLNAMQKFELI